MLEIITFFFIFGLLVFVHELGHFVAAKLAGVKVEEFGFGFPPRLFAVRRGETEYSINAVPLGGYVRMLGEDDPSEARSFASASKRWRATILLAGAAMNLVAGALLFGAAYMSGWPTPTGIEVQVQSVLPGSPAEQAGVQPDDVILSLNGQPVGDTDGLRAQTQTVLGQQTQMVVRRGDSEQTLTITPNPVFDPQRGALGVAIGNNPTGIEPISYPAGEALVKGTQEVGRTLALTASLPGLLMRGVVPAEVARPTGPVGIYQITSQATTQAASSGWWFPILWVAGALSVGLGFANLLPIPGLDGGRLLFVIIEAVRGRRISPEREGAIHMVGIVLLVTLSLVIAYYDFTRPLPTMDWGIK